MPTNVPPEADDDVIEALDELTKVLAETIERHRAAIDRGEVIRRMRAEGRSYSEILPVEERPLIVELLTRSLTEVSEASARFRKAEARALYAEGLTMAEIASLFGVTRQRVAALLRSSPAGRRGLITALCCLAAERVVDTGPALAIAIAT